MNKIEQLRQEIIDSYNTWLDIGFPLKNSKDIIETGKQHFLEKIDKLIQYVKEEKETTTNSSL